MSLSSFTKVAMLAIGDELLRGDVTDLNTPYLAKWLTKHGFILDRVVIVPDDRQQIIEELLRLKERYNMIFTSGGLGSTHDDVTLESISAALKRELVVSPDIKAQMIACYGDNLSESTLLMARMPAGSQLLFGAHRWVPVIITDGIYIIPGVPQIFAKCIDLLSNHFPEKQLAQGAIYLQVSESLIAPKLADIQKRYPQTVIGSYPNMSSPSTVKLNVVHEDAALVQKVLDELTNAFQPYLFNK